MTATMSAPNIGEMQSSATRFIARKRLFGFAVPTVIMAYLVYVFFAFDVPGLAERARMDNAAVLVADTYSYKTHVTRDNRNGGMRIAIEGETKGLYPQGKTPDWVDLTGPESAIVELPQGHSVDINGPNTRFDVPGYGTIGITAERSGIDLQLPTADVPDWINASNARVTITTDAGRVIVTRARTEVFRYSLGWELFWFGLESPYHGTTPGQILLGDQIDPARSNLAGAWQDFWANPMWRHADVAWAIGETILMAFLGTMGAAMIALPLAFLAAKRFAPFAVARFAVRRVFDFVRGVDALIWTVVLARAFGPGPLTGALAILVTDTGTFGKIFSEALENVDEKQIEGLNSTGANPIQRYRFGVIPQVMPVLLSQVLYFLESNTRSATIIGAITGGGIGLMLTQAIQTQKDWEEVSYYILLIILMVMLMDWLSGWLRGRLIGKSEGH